MQRCFVIQPFDKGEFDKRYAQVMGPAIKDAGLEPYRVDLDPSASVPIESVERKIRESDSCLADITRDNPNVWYEVGFAFASDKEVVLICSNKRETKYPFDVQHRHIIQYSTDCPEDFNELKRRITDRLKAVTNKREKVQQLSEMSALAPSEGLLHFEIAALVVIMENRLCPGDIVWSTSIQQDMQRNGFTAIAVGLSLESLAQKEFIEHRIINDNFNNESGGYSITKKGIEWLLANKDKLVLKVDPPPPRAPARRPIASLPPLPGEDEDIPF